MAGKYQAYPEYKNSGVEWLGEIPEHWNVANISNVSNKITNGYVGPTRGIFQEQGVRYLQSLHIKENKIKFHTKYFVSQKWSDEKTKSILKEGDVLVVQTGDVGQVAAVTKEFAGCNCHALIIISTTEKVSGFYLSWLLNSGYGVNSLKSIQTGALHPHLNCDTVKTVKTPIPSYEEQQQIADFLDYETAQIDTLIDKQQQLIQLLKEKRQAVISHAVTKGLNPDAPMKDSGIEWLGEVPKHWEVVSLAAIADVVDPNPSHRNPVYTDEGYPFISTVEFTGVDGLNMDTPRRVSEITVEEQEKRCKFQKGSIAFSRKGTIGSVRFLPHRQRFALLDSVCVINCSKSIDYDFLYQQIRSSVFDSQLGIETRGAALPQISVGKVRNIKVLLPTILEQKEIVSYLVEVLVINPA